MKTIKYVLLFICVHLLFASCDDGIVFHQYASIDKQGWHQDSAAVFQVDISDTQQDYDVIINIRNRNEYPYQNLYLFVSSTSPEGVIVSDTLNCILADNQGRWFGSGVGSVSNLPILYMRDIKFPVQGVYTFEIKQGMREKKLQGINDIGLKVELNEE